ncbi:hypothetical protein [Natrialba swarupiae]|uniref:Uncharacterized protein n=1 Tax=Natrialba swarupiae TaxID=2448032 RepID=A0A5D5AUP7_9EURY|nr:hypothetical protein [Natrialba swarupiae]TYT62801.1 hypothetical protein FYC77_07145 [Natrialba swarupiae]
MISPVVSLVAFVVALFVGSLAIYLGASVVTDEESYSRALLTAFLGAIAWAVTSWIPLVGSLLALFAWIWVINWRYPGGWIDAAVVGFAAWFVAFVILFVLNTVLGLGVGAFGVPGV